MHGPVTEVAPMIPFREAVGTWARVALLSFGGPAGQIAVMHRILVEEKKWISVSHPFSGFFLADLMWKL